jgi:hypothetical protein
MRNKLLAVSTTISFITSTTISFITSTTILFIISTTISFITSTTILFIISTTILFIISTTILFIISTTILFIISTTISFNTRPNFVVAPKQRRKGLRFFVSLGGEVLKTVLGRGLLYIVCRLITVNQN